MPEYKFYEPKPKANPCNECNKYYTYKGCAFFIPLEKSRQTCDNVLEILRRKEIISNIVASKQVSCNKHGCIILNACSVITEENKDFCKNNKAKEDSIKNCKDLKTYITTKLVN